MHHGKVSPEIAKGLLNLRKRIAKAEIPPSQLDQSINIAIWNIREFGKKRRTDAALHYIAEILNQFDLIALVELRDNLSDLGCVMDYLGTSWQVVYSDWIDDGGGNHERTAFLYDRRSVQFNGLAAEVDAPRDKKGEEYLVERSFWRAPYMCSFRAGNFDFIAIATHARWGKGTKGRQGELQMLADWIARRFTNKCVEDHDLIVLGDFNVPKLGDNLFKALTSHGLLVPTPLVNLKMGKRYIGGTNLGGNARYDQILHLPSVDKYFANKGGSVDFFISDKRIKELFPGKGYTRTKFTYQMSDHLPVWIQVKTDIDAYRLDQIVQNSKKD